MITSVWIVRGDSYKEDWGPFFATEREAKDYVYQEWGLRCRYEGVLPSEATFKPANIKEYRLDTVEKAIAEKCGYLG